MFSISLFERSLIETTWRVSRGALDTISLTQRSSWPGLTFVLVVRWVFHNRTAGYQNAALVAADGERIEQRLGWMLVRAVAGIDHGAIDLAGEQLDRARGVVAHHDDVGAHGVEGDRGVDQRLALAHGGGADRHVHDIGAEPLARELERGLGAGRDLEEQVDQRAPAQRGLLLVDLAVELDELLGQVEQAQNLVARKPFDPQQVALAEDERGLLGDRKS